MVLRCAAWWELLRAVGKRFKTQSLLLPRIAVLIHVKTLTTKCSSPTFNNGTGVPTVLSFSHSFQSCVFQSSNLGVICPSPFQGQKLITRPVRLVKVWVCVCAHTCVWEDTQTLPNWSGACQPETEPPSELFTSHHLFPFLQKSFREGTWQMYFHLMLWSYFALSPSVCHIFRTLWVSGSGFILPLTHFGTCLIPFTWQSTLWVNWYTGWGGEQLFRRKVI